MGSPVLSPAPQVLEKPINSSRKPRILSTPSQKTLPFPVSHSVCWVTCSAPGCPPTPGRCGVTDHSWEVPRSSQSALSPTWLSAGLWSPLWGQSAHPHKPPQLCRAQPCHVGDDSCGQFHPEVLPWHCPLSCICSAACLGHKLKLHTHLPGSQAGGLRQQNLCAKLKFLYRSPGTAIKWTHWCPPAPTTHRPSCLGFVGSREAAILSLGSLAIGRTRPPALSTSLHPLSPARVSLRPGT